MVLVSYNLYKYETANKRVKFVWYSTFLIKSDFSRVFGVSHFTLLDTSIPLYSHIVDCTDFSDGQLFVRDIHKPCLQGFYQGICSSLIFHHFHSFEYGPKFTRLGFTTVRNFNPSVYLGFIMPKVEGEP